MATKDIAEGEELSIAYVDPLSPVKMRKQVFKGFGFDCSCSLCED